jgi:hypothetical protein
MSLKSRAVDESVAVFIDDPTKLNVLIETALDVALVAGGTIGLFI